MDAVQEPAGPNTFQEKVPKPALPGGELLLVPGTLVKVPCRSFWSWVIDEWRPSWNLLVCKYFRRGGRICVWMDDKRQQVPVFLEPVSGPAVAVLAPPLLSRSCSVSDPQRDSMLPVGLQQRSQQVSVGSMVLAVSGGAAHHF